MEKICLYTAVACIICFIMAWPVMWLINYVFSAATLETCSLVFLLEPGPVLNRKENNLSASEHNA
jgi:hypothetical protein